jgi:hypothetical protein
MQQNDGLYGLLMSRIWLNHRSVSIYNKQTYVWNALRVQTDTYITRAKCAF